MADRHVRANISQFSDRAELLSMIPSSASGAATHGLPAFANPEDDFDKDSAYGDDTYHAYQDGAYWGPNDELAKEHQDLTHHLYLLTFEGRLHLAPLENPQRVLDVGCGTGIWAIDFADDNPNCQVTGADLSPIQPDFVPTNCSFEVDDVTQTWTHPDNHFDFVHIREMFGSISDWDDFLQTVYRHVEPGGWVEIVEHSVQPVSDDGSVDANHFFTRWGQTVLACGEVNKKSFGIWEESKSIVQRAGFQNVQELRFRWPINAWPKDAKLKELGRWNQLRLHDGLEGMMLRLLTRSVRVSSEFPWSYEQAQAFLAQMRESLMDYSTHAYLEGTVVFGQKPR